MSSFNISGVNADLDFIGVEDQSAPNQNYEIQPTLRQLLAVIRNLELGSPSQISGTLVAGRVTLSGSANTVTDDAGLIFDIPTGALTVGGSIDTPILTSISGNITVNVPLTIGSTLDLNGNVISNITGSNTEILFNDTGDLGSDPGLTFVKATGALTVNGRGNFGSASVPTSSAGANNEAWGAGALSAITTGIANTAIGVDAGNGITDEDENVLVGYNADIAVNVLSSVGIGKGARPGTRGICIGANAEGGDQTTSGNIIIGESGGINGLLGGAGASCIIGSPTTSIDEVTFGKGMYVNSGIYGAVANFTINGNSCASGNTDTIGGHIRISGGRSTGTGAPGSVSIQTAFAAASTGTTLNTRIDRIYVNATRKALTDAATSLFEIALPAAGMTGGSIQYMIRASNGTDHQVLSGFLTWSAVNKAGVYTKQVTITTESLAASSGTLTAAFSLLDGTNKVTMQVTPTGSLTETTYDIAYIITNNANHAITIL